MQILCEFVHSIMRIQTYCLHLTDLLSSLNLFTMVKQKLIDKRKAKGLSQTEMAQKLNIEQSQYSRRESGVTQIMKKEWDKIAKILDVPL